MVSIAKKAMEIRKGVPLRLLLIKAIQPQRKVRTSRLTDFTYLPHRYKFF